ncbi:MAG: glycosyltransferase family A protein, partial [Prevotella sp.]|nr:glycosyltransferase family A protein [Prevotella sp.]
MTEITLAICMYNAENYIEETLACIMTQTMQDFHLLIVDDCSTDNSTFRVENFFKQNDRQYELVQLAENQGIAYARNFAIRHARTKYIIFVDSDDMPLPQLIEKEYTTLQNDDDLIAVSSWSQ